MKDAQKKTAIQNITQAWSHNKFTHNSMSPAPTYCRNQNIHRKTANTAKPDVQEEFAITVAYMQELHKRYPMLTEG